MNNLFRISFYSIYIYIKKSPSRIDSYSTILMNSKLSYGNLSEINDQNEILTLVDLLVLRVECLTNENKLKKQQKSKNNYPTAAEVDQNLIEYLYYLFTKFVNDDSQPSDDETTLPPPIIDKTNFVTVCQTLVRNGCFDMPSPDQSTSEASSSSSDPTLTPETFLHEYHPDATDTPPEETPPDEQETWLVVDLQPSQSEEQKETSELIVSFYFHKDVLQIRKGFFLHTICLMTLAFIGIRLLFSLCHY